MSSSVDRKSNDNIIICQCCSFANSSTNYIDVYCRDSSNQEMAAIITQYIHWFKVNQDDPAIDRQICEDCWQNVNQFHKFYQRAKTAHHIHISTWNDSVSQQHKDDGIAQQDDQKLVDLLLPASNCGVDDRKGDAIDVSPPFQPCFVKLERIDEIDEDEVDIYLDRPSDDDVIDYDDVDQMISKKQPEQATTNNVHACEVKIDKRFAANDAVASIGPAKEEEVLVTQAKIDESKSVDGKRSVPKKKVGRKFEVGGKTDKERQRKAVRDLDDQRMRDFYEWKCEFCGANDFPSFTALSNHYRNEHEQTQVIIKCCDKKFNRRGLLLSHMIWHIDPDSLRCPHCQRVYKNFNQLKEHMIRHVPPEQRSYICDYCAKTFATKELIRKHMYGTHRPGDTEPHKCPHCDKLFKFGSLLRAHIQSKHVGNNVHVCFVCANEFSSKSSCDAHVRNQHKEKRTQVQCHMCSEWLANKYSLKTHMGIKHFSKPVKCPKCGKQSPSASALSMHLKYVHEDLPVFQCQLCDKMFKKAVVLKEHMATHTGIHLYTCTYCPQTFACNSNRHKHRKKNHPVEWARDRRVGRLWAPKDVEQK